MLTPINRALTSNTPGVSVALISNSTFLNLSEKPLLYKTYTYSNYNNSSDINISLEFLYGKKNIFEGMLHIYHITNNSQEKEFYNFINT